MTVNSKLAAGARILPDVSASKAGDSDSVAVIKAIIAQVDCKTPDFCQRVIAFVIQSGDDIDDALSRSKTVTSPKALVAKWLKAGYSRGSLIKACKDVSLSLDPKAGKPKSDKSAKSSAGRQTKPKPAKQQLTDVHNSMKLMFPALFGIDPKRVAEAAKAKKPSGKGKPGRKPKPVAPAPVGTIQLSSPTKVFSAGHLHMVFENELPILSAVPAKFSLVPDETREELAMAA